MNITLKKLKVYPEMCEETTAFTAEIYADGKKIGHAKNDGHGGSTMCSPYPETRAEFKAAEAYCLTLPPNKYEVGNDVFTTPSNLESVVDNLVEIEWQEKERENFKKKMLRNMKKGLLVGSETRYSIISWAGYNLEKLLETPRGRAAVVSKILELKSKKQKVLNTNLPPEILKLC